jgi:hypothetical protein
LTGTWGLHRGFAAALSAAFGAFVFLAALTLTAGAAPAATLSDADYRYLQDKYGLTAKSEELADLTPDEATKLHDLIDDPAMKDYPFTRDNNVSDFLFTAHIRECQVWSLAHGSPECPPVADAKVEAGKEVADRRCNFCHLFGTENAPTFRQLARAGKLDEPTLAADLDHGHFMSPIALAPDDIKALLVYIKSLN